MEYGLKKGLTLVPFCDMYLPYMYGKGPFHHTPPYIIYADIGPMKPCSVPTSSLVKPLFHSKIFNPSDCNYLGW